jgi:hypothetical protein
MMSKPIALAAALAALPMIASAQAVPATCTVVDASLPPALAGWTTRTDMVSAASVADLSKASIVVGQAVKVTLRGMGDVAYAVPPEKPGGAGHGGLLRLTVQQPGRYQVALSTSGWIDLVKDGAVSASIAHGHGPDCSTIHKRVTYSLDPGRYVLQISASADPQVELMVAPNP